ncbi:hypothetical protein BH11MYX2_BH11MYX2_12690 [soil metagenome]
MAGDLVLDDDRGGGGDDVRLGVEGLLHVRIGDVTDALSRSADGLGSSRPAPDVSVSAATDGVPVNSATRSEAGTCTPAKGRAASTAAGDVTIASTANPRLT